MGSPVIGPAKNGGTARQMPVEVGGVSTDGKLRSLKLGTDGSLSLGGATVEIGEVQLLGADGVTLAVIDANGLHTMEQTGLVPKVFDWIGYTATSATVDTYVYKTGGSGGSTVATVTVTYTDATHNVLVSVSRT